MTRDGHIRTGPLARTCSGARCWRTRARSRPPPSAWSWSCSPSSVFSVTAAVTNARAARHAQASAVVQEWAESALEGLVEEEDLVDALKLHGDEADPDAAEEYRQTRGDVQDSLAALKAAVVPERRELVEEWGSLHSRYGQAVQVMVAIGPTDPHEAEQFEESYLDPHYDTLEAALTREVQRLYAESNQALLAVGRFQQATLVATPVAFGLGLALVLAFSVVLVRGRRLVVEQAEENRHQALHDALTGLPNRTLLRQRGGAGAAHGRGRRAAASPCCSSTSTASRRSTTRSATTTATSCCRWSRTGCAPALGAADRRRAPRRGRVRRGAARRRRTSSGAGRRRAGPGRDGREHRRRGRRASTSTRASGSWCPACTATTSTPCCSTPTSRCTGPRSAALGVCVYDADLNEHSREQLGLLGELRRAIDNDELVLHFQPKVTLPGARFCGAEALVRWQHPDARAAPARRCSSRSPSAPRSSTR